MNVKSILKLLPAGDRAKAISLIRSQKWQPRDAQDVYSFLKSTKEHKDMCLRYWPTSGLTAQEKLVKTANTVGFQMPKLFVESEANQDLKSFSSRL